MANRLYDKGRDAFADGLIDWTADDIRCCLVNSSYTPDFANDEFLSTPAANILTNSRLGASMTSKTSTAGVCAADNVTLGSSNITGTATYILIYLHTGSDATARLIALIDVATGMPAVLSSATVTITWDVGANKIFKL